MELPAMLQGGWMGTCGIASPSARECQVHLSLVGRELTWDSTGARYTVVSQAAARKIRQANGHQQYLAP